MRGPNEESEEKAQGVPWKFELYKTSHKFDTTEKKPEYLG